MNLAERAKHHESCAVMNGSHRCTCDVTKGTEKLIRECAGKVAARAHLIHSGNLPGGGNADFVFLKELLPIIRNFMNAAVEQAK